MKKIIVLILALIMVLGLVGCSSVPAEEATNTPQSPEGTTQTPESEEDSSASIKLGVPVTAGNWEYTLVGIEFAKDVITFLEYENFLVPGSDPSLTNPLGLEEDEMLAVVTYKLKMIGKEVQSVWDKDVYNTVGTGKFIFGDGFVFENDTVGDRAEPYYFNGTVFEDMAFMSLEPLSEEIECRVAFCVLSKVVENTSEPLVYEIAFGETGDNMMFTYTIR